MPYSYDLYSLIEWNKLPTCSIRLFAEWKTNVGVMWLIYPPGAWSKLVVQTRLREDVWQCLSLSWRERSIWLLHWKRRWSMRGRGGGVQKPDSRMFWLLSISWRKLVAKSPNFGPHPTTSPLPPVSDIRTVPQLESILPSTSLGHKFEWRAEANVAKCELLINQESEYLVLFHHFSCISLLHWRVS